MTAEILGFWVAAVVLVAASLAVVLTPNLFHAVLWLAAALVATGIVFLLLDSPFLFAVQLLLYAGGVVTIVVFAIMLTERLAGESIRQMNRGIGWGTVVAVGVFASVGGVILRAPGPAAGRGAVPGTTAALGRALLTDWVLPFEVLGVLLVAALLGAVYLARTEE
jgi:NADH:ubiquinone oxidoreductase subunit 6 (subunit J)